MPTTEPTQPRADSSGHDDIPKMEPWLAVALTSFVPVVLALFVPLSLHFPLYAGGGVLLGAGIVMFVRSEKRKRG